MVHHHSPTGEMDADPDGNRPKGLTDGRPAPRQACIECRRRKIKCSGFGKSGCKTCKVAGVECVFPESQKRGPHKGYFETISTRLSRIERMLQDAIEKQANNKHEGSSDEDDGPERKRRRSKQHPRRHSHERPLPPMAALVAPTSLTAPDIPFHNYRPRISISSIPSPSLPSPEESALGVLAQVAHELEPTVCAVVGDYFTDANVLPADLAESLVNMFYPDYFIANESRYFDIVHPLFPIVHKNSFLGSFHRTLDKSGLPDHLAWAVFLAASHYSDDPRLQVGGIHSCSQIEIRLKLACERDLEQGKSTDLSLIQSLILGQLFPAKRERKVALLSWARNGRAIKLAMKRQLNINPSKLGFDPETSRTRMLTWWCVYIVDIWDAARRGRPPSIHEGDFDIPLPTILDPSSDGEIFFVRLVSLTRILSKVLSFGFNNCQTSSSTSNIDAATEETVRDIRIQLADWYRTETSPRAPPSLLHNLLVAYLTVVILLHRPLQPATLATAFSDPIVLLVSQCASSIVQIAQHCGVSEAGSVPWRLFVPAVGYLTAGVTLARNAAWSVHVLGATALRLSAQRDINILLDVFDQAELQGHNTAGMSMLLRNIFQRSGVELVVSPNTSVPEIQGAALPLPHEDPSFSVARIHVSNEKSMSPPEKRVSVPNVQPLAPGSMPAPSRSQSLTDRKRKHSQVSLPSSSMNKPTPQSLPSLANLAGLDAGRRSPTMRSVHSLSTYSSNSSASHSRHAPWYQPVTPHAPSTAYHPSYTPRNDSPISGRSGPPKWEASRPMSPPLPPLYDRRYPDVQYSPSSRDYPKQSQQLPYYPDRRDDYYPRSISPSHPYASHEQSQNYPRPSYPSKADPTYHRGPPPPPKPLDPRYRHPTPPLSAATSASPSWPPGYPYVAQQPQQRYEATSPKTLVPVGQNRYHEYYNYPQPRN